MENLAFTSLVILFFAVPGYVYRSMYFSEDFSKDVTPRSITEEIYLSILFSLPFHAIAFAILDWLYIRSSTNLYVDLDTVFGALTGQYSKDPAGERLSLADNIYKFFTYITGYFVGIAIVAGIAGRVFRSIVWNLKLDVRMPSLFRYRNRWLYTLTGRENEGDIVPVVDILCHLGGERSRIYRGIVWQFDTNEEGDLDEIHLSFAQRGKFSEDKKQFTWKDIPGDVFVIKYGTVQSLNIRWVPAASFDPTSLSSQLMDHPSQVQSSGEPSSTAPPGQGFS